MTDIVDRLREPAGQFGKSMVLCGEAALEIERLRMPIADLVAENDQLRAALKPFAEIARRMGWDKITADDPEWGDHIMECPADDIAPGAVYCLMACAFNGAAAALRE